RFLGEPAVITERAEHFVSRDVVEAETGPARTAPACMGERGLEQRIGADNIGRDEISWRIDRAVDMAFGGKMHDGIGVETGEQAVDRRAVADIGEAESIARMGFNRFERSE